MDDLTNSFDMKHNPARTRPRVNSGVVNSLEKKKTKAMQMQILSRKYFTFQFTLIKKICLHIYLGFEDQSVRNLPAV